MSYSKLKRQEFAPQNKQSGMDAAHGNTLPMEITLKKYSLGMVLHRSISPEEGYRDSTR